MGKFAELCKGRTMGAFFLLLLSPGKTLRCMEEDQTTVAATIGHECALLTRGSNYLYPFGEHRFYPRDIVNCDDFTECG